MNKTVVALALIFLTTTASAGEIDCSVIKNNPTSREKCEAGVRDARKWELERQRQELKEQRIKEALRDTRDLGVKCIKGKLSCVKEALKPKKAE